MATSFNDSFTFSQQEIERDFDSFHKTFKHYGVAVITNVFAPEECDYHTDAILSAFENLGTGVRRDDVDTWKPKPLCRIPHQKRVCLFQQIFSNLPNIWDIRSDDRLVSFFARLYGDEHLIVSGDGINVALNGRTQQRSANIDWAHLDSVGPFDGCIQGQVVLTDTSAAFRCSPRSHAIYKTYMLRELNETRKTNKNWHKLNAAQIEWFKEHMPEDGQYQVRIPAPRGSVILWYSNVLHSAASAQETVAEVPADNPYMGTRCVVYVSYQTVSMYYDRPPVAKKRGEKNKRKNHEYSRNEQIEARAKTVKANVSTNHRGQPMPYKRGRFAPPASHEVVDAIQADPSKVYDLLGFTPKPLWDDKCARLAGIKPYPS
mmetsp:Transcript_5578/g.8356  ORF Transcript_5578/g.8356 Transcript_5578/m.8356 type:complete len:374 (+) Transcript_5578:63-1184(+)|eukprot:CAMPEP_0116996078 /NCGR_PEP_ID=MMETSP0472-20121206/19_1 /TAXON_ID=693140 ORGANISM="Tiarina fusus, Strain LIS" /NCGR_SAMPLE_ID=MMETSP0472 /ASSEMBLY_ACC=CAM_ASM_000603 /LENGTH=373 /DNA_ID=CAMNT_0004694609 /DNA_START=63 /DNA_END=1184 /DNA_ORIENTATION=+